MRYELSTVYVDIIANIVTITLSREIMNNSITGAYAVTVDIYKGSLQERIPVPIEYRYARRYLSIREGRIAFGRMVSRIEAIESRVKKAYLEDNSLMEECYEHFIKDLAIQELTELCY